MIYRNKLLVSECIFKFNLLLWELQVIRDLLCVRGISEKSLSRLLQLLILKTSHRRCSVKKVLLKILPISHKTPVLEAFLKKDSNTCIFPVRFLRIIKNLLKIRLWHRCFPVSFAKFLRAPFVTEHLRWLLLLLHFLSSLLCYLLM